MLITILDDEQLLIYNINNEHMLIMEFAMANNQERREGAEGQLYFTFNKGAEFKFTSPCSTSFTHKIIACELDEQENEYYRIESAGKELSARFSVNQINLLLSQIKYEQTADGEPVELPLLLEEVRAYFAAKAKQMKKANVAENAKLKGTKWNGNLQAIKTITENLRFERANGNAERAGELQAALEKLEAEQKQILADKKVNELALRKVPDCKACNDTGEIGGKICGCALAMVGKIKDYCASERLARR